MSSPGIYPKFHATDPSTGLPLVGGLLYTYAAGTSTPLATYADSGLTTPNANPVVLDATGDALLYCGPVGYKFLLQNSLGVQLWSVDNYYPNVAAIVPGSQWYPYGSAAAFQTSITFTTAGNQTATFTVGLRLQSHNTAGTVYSTVTASSYSAGTTTVTVSNDGTSALDSGFSQLAYSLLPYSPSPYLDPRSAVCATGGGQSGIGTSVTTLALGTEQLDALGEFSPTTHLFTARYPGNYLITANAYVQIGGTGCDVLLATANNFSGPTVTQQSVGAASAQIGLSVSQVINVPAALSLYATVQFAAGSANSILTSSLTVTRIP